MSDATGGLRIGELAARVGLSPHALRKWEERYGLLRPTRTLGGYRLYGPDDERRLREVLALRAHGVAPAQAAARVLATDRDRLPEPAVRDDRLAGEGSAAQILRRDLLRCAIEFDEAGAEAALDEVLARLSLTAAADEAVLPFLADIGRQWEAGVMGIAGEHFITAVIRRRFAAVAMPRTAAAPVALLACPPTELHELPLVLFGSLLAQAGWRVRHLGADTPVPDLLSALDGVDVVVLAATSARRFLACATELALVAERVPLTLAGAGAAGAAPAIPGVHLLPPRQGAAVEALRVLVHSATSGSG